jgi:transposase
MRFNRNGNKYKNKRKYRSYFIDNYPDNIKFINIEPYSPELNPAERVWQYIKDKLAWSVFKNLE